LPLSLLNVATDLKTKLKVVVPVLSLHTISESIDIYVGVKCFGGIVVKIV